MGNQVSCRSSVSISGHLIEASCKVLLPGGEIQKLREPIKAAEIMLEHSGHFLVNAGSLVAGRRFSGVAADDDLEFGSVYVMFPMKRLGSVITAADVGMLVRAAAACTEKRVSAGNGTKVSPAEGVLVRREMTSAGLTSGWSIADIGCRLVDRGSLCWKQLRKNLAVHVGVDQENLH